MFYATSTGGFYAEEIHGTRQIEVVQTDPETGETIDRWMEKNPGCLIPPDAVEISAADHVALLAGQAAGQRIQPDADGRPVLIDPQPPTDAEIISDAIQRIDGFCDMVYTRLTSRATRYEQKYQESLRFRDAGYPGTVSANDYPYLAYEAPHRGMTKRDLADLIIAKAEAFNQFGARAEAARAELPGAVAAADPTEKQNAADAIVSAINALVQALMEA
ncbi:hypothetical protein [Sedimenticola hydrogenitrophicus]|uniref:hypothetical protein n=1 Tax=Sedimenticola hydrogenitrophicus TaxID=2967975 RepID=UPI0023AE6BE9|nr:hypothetical protein [Sedimenticola hydrogenitrophicus]